MTDIENHYRKLFNKVDANQDGRIDIVELAEYLKTRKIPHGDVQVQNFPFSSIFTYDL